MLVARAALALVLLTPALAGAAPKAVCADPRGDVRLSGADLAADRPQVDLVSADWVTSRTSFLALVQAAEPGGDGVYRMTFTVGRTRYFAQWAPGRPNMFDPDAGTGFLVGAVGGKTYRVAGVAFDDMLVLAAPRSVLGGVTSATMKDVEVTSRETVAGSGSTRVAYADHYRPVRAC